jgi:hypothetical protein
VKLNRVPLQTTQILAHDVKPSPITLGLFRCLPPSIAKSLVYIQSKGIFNRLCGDRG